MMSMMGIATLRRSFLMCDNKGSSQALFTSQWLSRNINTWDTHTHSLNPALTQTKVRVYQTLVLSFLLRTSKTSTLLALKPSTAFTWNVSKSSESNGTISPKIPKSLAHWSKACVRPDYRVLEYHIRTCARPPVCWLCHMSKYGIPTPCTELILHQALQFLVRF